MPRAKKAPAEPPKRGRGRPAIPGGRRYESILTDLAGDGLYQYLADWQDWAEDATPEKSLPKAAEVGRDMLTAYAESAEVRAAIAAWRAGRAP